MTSLERMTANKLIALGALKPSFSLLDLQHLLEALLDGCVNLPE